MGKVGAEIGKNIRSLRKANGMTLQQMADSIHKSRATVSKYETGEIVLDVETLYDIAQVLQVSPKELMSENTISVPPISLTASASGQSPFFQADTLYFYFYDGRYNRLKNGVIRVRKDHEVDGGYEASFSITTNTAAGRSMETHYSGRVVYSDMLIRFSFVNLFNALEEDLLYIFNPLERRDFTEGLLCGISSADLMPCAFKCLVTLSPRELNEELKQQLLITTKELRRWQKLNMLIVDNKGDI